MTSSESIGTFDYIIIGAGTAGCVLANRLSQRKGSQVLLIEAGGKDDYVWVHIPVGYLYCIDNPRTDWRYKTESEPGLNGRRLIYPRGKVLGGCSSINGMIYMRGQRQDYDDWASVTGDDRWRWDNVLPIFLRSEDHHAGANPFHGVGGEWRVEKQRLRWDILDAFREAAAQTGIQTVSDFNQGDNEGCGYFEVNQKNGLRWNTAKAFLKSNARQGALTIMTGCHVEKLIFEKNESGLRCSGVEFTGGAKRWRATAHHETVLAAGAIGSPQILQHSGVGPLELLQRHQITPTLVHEGVGANLQDHLQLRMVFKVKDAKTLNTMANSWWGKAAIAAEYLVNRTGPMSMAPSQLGLFTRSDPTQLRANIQYHVQPLSLERFGEPLHAFPAFTASVCNLRPSSRGKVEIAGADPYLAPKISLNYLATAEDRRVAADAIRITRRIAQAPALQRYAPEELKPGADLASDVELEKAAGDIGTTIFHPVGTCKMGAATDPAAVVDSELRVRGVAGLRVVDASIMPTITSGNCNSPVIMIAERASDLILAAHA
ncbi:MAG: GMC family oxidoreductase N-terminal domain-containing protein [Burkholderiales bacterium]|nr:GMC family oxidoreductase N-terminal domain-containing protein [Burkholderiales bacterium]